MDIRPVAAVRALSRCFAWKPRKNRRHLNILQRLERLDGHRLRDLADGAIAAVHHEHVSACVNVDAFRSIEQRVAAMPILPNRKPKHNHMTWRCQRRTLRSKKCLCIIKLGGGGCLEGRDIFLENVPRSVAYIRSLLN